MNASRFRFFKLVNKETDLWIGVSKAFYQKEMEDFCSEKLYHYRNILESYIYKYPVFGSSMEPLTLEAEASEIIFAMKSASDSAETGPMAAVAGAFADFMCRDIMRHYNPDEIVVENGGDICVRCRDELLVQFYAGKNDYFKKLALQIDAVEDYIGVCTSSGMYGHSFSYGLADSVTVVAESAAMADAWATALCNKIMNKKAIINACQLVRLDRPFNDISAQESL